MHQPKCETYSNLGLLIRPQYRILIGMWHLGIPIRITGNLGAWPYQLQEAIQPTQFQFSACTGLDTFAIRQSQLEAHDFQCLSRGRQKARTSLAHQRWQISKYFRPCCEDVSVLVETSQGVRRVLGRSTKSKLWWPTLQLNLTLTIRSTRSFREPIQTSLYSLWVTQTCITRTLSLAVVLVGKGEARKYQQLSRRIQDILRAHKSEQNKKRPSYTVAVIGASSADIGPASPGDLSFLAHPFCEVG